MARRITLCPECKGEPRDPDCAICGGSGAPPSEEATGLHDRQICTVCGGTLIHAAPPSEEATGLDVERLAEALRAVTREVLYPADRGYDKWRRSTARSLATEYARLTAADGVRE